MSEKPVGAFDFDGWMALARKDEAAFERLRALAIQEMIASVPIERRPRLRRLQWRVDMERRLAGTPEKAFRRLFAMMWDSVYGERGLQRALSGMLEGVVQSKDGNDVKKLPVLPRAKVLKLRAAPRSDNQGETPNR